METFPTNFPLHLFLLLLTLTPPITAAAAAINDTAASAPSSCTGSIADCNQDMEMLMESEISRRFLEQKKKYISPGALKRDQPVCNGGAPGEPYSRGGGCVPEPSNPYHRGCSRYYQCRGDQ